MAQRVPNERRHEQHDCCHHERDDARARKSPPEIRDIKGGNLAARKPEHHARVKSELRRVRQHEAEDAERRDERERHGEQHADRHRPDDHGRARVLARVKGEQQQLVPGDERQPDGVANQCDADFRRARRRGLAVIKEQRDHGLREHDQAEHHGQNERGNDAHSQRERLPEARRVALRLGTREARQRGDVDRRHHEADRQLLHLRGKAHRRDAMIVRALREVAVNDQRRTVQEQPEKHGQVERANAPQVTVAPCERGPDHEATAPKAEQLQQHEGHRPDQDADDERVNA